MDERFRRRLLAVAGLWLLLGGLLAALSFVLVVLAVSAVLVLALVVFGGLRLLSALDVRPALATAAAWGASALEVVRTRAPRPRAPRTRVREQARSLGTWTRTAAAHAPERTEALASRAFHESVNGLYRLRLLRLHSVDLSRRAMQLNELGAQLRREGEPEQAVEQHRAALAIVRDLGDQQAEAMTLNNLGLALAHSGAEKAAVEHLEQAVDVLRELGDEEHEGRVIANLGTVYRRQGLSEEATFLFQEALEKLPPASPAYRQVEDELGRAS
ncbi:MAG TPA: tetratricopeptide repeat protein [Gaiellaceae bacterium]